MSFADDRGLLLGDGLFETVLAEAGGLVDWTAHMERLERGCAVLGLPAPERDRCGREAEAALRDAGLEGTRAAVRLTWTAGGGGRGLDRPEPVRPLLRVSASAAPEPEPEPEGAAALMVASVRRNSGSPTSRLKTVSYLDNVLARAEARAQGCDEAVMLNERGEVACAAAGNLFWIAEGRLFTPALECGVLEGVVRAGVLAAAAELGVEAVETRAPLQALEGAEAAFLTNSLVRVRAVRSLGARTFGPSALVETLAAAVRSRCTPR